MKQNIQMFQAPSSLWAKFLDSNPQLFREIKGKLKTRNVIIAAVISCVTQFLIVISLMGELPDFDPEGILKSQYGRYALGNGYTPVYTKDMFGRWVINWQLFWLDLFIILSVVSIFTLLIIGTYMLVADLVQEENRGTLNFIRMTPQSSGTILLGKVLGVPILLYIAILLLFPLHLMAGLGARIPLAMIVGFDAVIVSGCAFCYTLALLWSLMNFGISGFQPWVATSAISLFLFSTTTALFHNRHLLTHSAWDWLLFFNPGIVLSYLIQATYLPYDKIHFLPAEHLGELLFYGQALWTKAWFGITFIWFNFCLWAYWCCTVLQRRFHNPERTILSKAQSYWITSWFVVMALGLTLQQHQYHSIIGNFIFLQLTITALGLGLIVTLSPHRQALYDWARYRHQTKHTRVLWKELIFGENSPSVVAIAINMAIAIIYITPSIFLILDEDQQYIFWGFVLSGISILLYSLVAQLALTWKARQRAIWSAIVVTNLIILPPLCLGLMEISPHNAALPWLFSFIPTVAMEHATLSAIITAMLGQLAVTFLLTIRMTQKLKLAGASETRTLLENQ